MTSQLAVAGIFARRVEPLTCFGKGKLPSVARITAIMVS